MSDLDQHAPDESADGWISAPAAMLEGLPDAVLAVDSEQRIVFVNARAERLFGYPRADLLGRSVQVLWPERHRARYARNLRRHFASENPVHFTTEAWGITRDGVEFPGELSWGAVQTRRGPVLLAIGRDISARRATEARLRAVAALGERALAGADAAELAAEMIELMTAVLPIAGAQVRTADATVLAGPRDLTAAGLVIGIGTGDALHIAVRSPLSDEDLGLVRALANTLATALERLRDEERTRHDALHDPLTGLANRTLLRDRLRLAFARAGRHADTPPRLVGILFVDLDRFKDVNDHHGHSAGDAVLVELAARLRAAVRPGDTIARYGGDEFVAVCERVDEAAAVTVAERVLAAVRRPLRIAGAPHAMSASVGVALGADDGEGLLAAADAAAYLAKSLGRGRVEVASVAP